MAVPTRMAFPALGLHIVDAACLDKLLVELFVTADAVVHDHLVRHRLRLNGLMLTVRDEVGYMLHAVKTFEAIVSQQIAVGHMAVVARRIASMRGVAPRGIVGRHDMTVDAGCRIITDNISVHA